MLIWHLLASQVTVHGDGPVVKQPRFAFLAVTFGRAYIRMACRIENVLPGSAHRHLRYETGRLKQERSK